MSGAAAPAPWADREARVGGVRLHLVEAGVGRPVLLLHGFPGFWYCWRQQIPALAAAGFRAVAPDLRGYNLSDRPRGVASYAIRTLVDDVAALAERLGGRATLVGHDWGGVIAWYTAMLRPERVERLVVLNAPHPFAYTRELLRSSQALRSWYALFFQLPRLPELALRAFGFAVVRRALRAQPVRVGAFDDEDVRRYVEALARPGALTAALNYYRAVLRRPPRLKPAERRPIDAPTLLIWGVRDRYLVTRLTEGLEPWVPRLRVARLDAGHWVQHDAPAEVNRLIIDFLREQS